MRSKISKPYILAKLRQGGYATINSRFTSSAWRGSLGGCTLFNADGTIDYDIDMHDLIELDKEYGFLKDVYESGSLWIAEYRIGVQR